MAAVTIEAEGLSKLYRVRRGRPPGGNLREAITDFARETIQRLIHPGAPPPPEEEFWALADLSLTVSEGEVLGVIGKNGAGKTTLLKLLARITEPTRGRALLRGRVASLLEVGTGFHPELTGRENIYLNGTILGMRKREIDARFDEIVAFAEVERFLDTPVKRYSSGMHVRLAFAVAAHLDPEILLVDEVLAVGDAAFQRKCLGKLDEVAHSGRTVLFVSHNMAAVERLSTRAILLAGGRLVASGSPREVINAYLAGEERPRYQAERRTGKPQLLSAEVLGTDGAPLPAPTCSEPFVLHLHYVLPEAAPGTRVGVGFLSADGIPLFTSNTGDVDLEVPGRPGEYEARVEVPAQALLAGDYHVAVCLWNEREILDLEEPALSFAVEPGSSRLYLQQPQRKGFVHVECGWSVVPHREVET